MLTEHVVKRIQIADLKAKARMQNRNHMWAELRATIAQLEQLWHDDHAAAAFYTELEQAIINEENDERDTRLQTQ